MSVPNWSSLKHTPQWAEASNKTFLEAIESLSGSYLPGTIHGSFLVTDKENDYPDLLTQYNILLVVIEDGQYILSGTYLQFYLANYIPIINLFQKIYGPIKESNKYGRIT